MKEYPKINTMYKRNMDGDKKIIVGDFCDPEVEYLKDLKWECTEKIDGTNISVVWNGEVSFHGRTEKAVIPEHLLRKLEQVFTKQKMSEFFPIKEDGDEIILYGEGYGVKIQKGGNYIPNDVNFILFDVFVNGWWLNRQSCEEIAKELEIDIVPLIGYMSIPEAEEMVSNGFKSTIAENKNYNAEGLVLKTLHGLKNRSGKRIIVKIKTVDYR